MVIHDVATGVHTHAAAAADVRLQGPDPEFDAGDDVVVEGGGDIQLAAPADETLRLHATVRVSALSPTSTYPARQSWPQRCPFLTRDVRLQRARTMLPRAALTSPTLAIRSIYGKNPTPARSSTRMICRWSLKCMRPMCRLKQL